MWQRLADILKTFLDLYVKRYLTTAAMSLLGIAGGIWGWIIGLIVSKGVQEIKEEIDEAAYLADKKAVDQVNLDAYKKVINNPEATDADKIKAELDLLNSVNNGD